MVKHALLFIVVIALLPGCSETPLSVDPQDFVGTWHIEIEELEATLTFSADGTFRQEVKAIGQIEKMMAGDMEFSGTWKVERGYLIGDVTESTDEARMPVGTKFEDWILEFEPENRFVVRSGQDDRLEHYQWVPQEPIENSEPIENEEPN